MSAPSRTQPTEADPRPVGGPVVAVAILAMVLVALPVVGLVTRAPWSRAGASITDPRTLDAKWEFRMTDITWGGTLATAADLVFSGGREGYFLALDARTGQLLWKASVGGQINAGAMSYAVNDKQYVAIAAGNALFAYALP